eukprot:4295733-Pyramimonas_sp.AAC.1
MRQIRAPGAMPPGELHQISARGHICRKVRQPVICTIFALPKPHCTLLQIRAPSRTEGPHMH